MVDLPVEYEDVLDVIAELDDKSHKFVYAKSKETSVTAACEKVGIDRQWFYRKPEEERLRLKEIARRIRNAKVEETYMMAENAAPMAMQALIDNLQDRYAGARVAAAKEILRVCNVAPKDRSEIDVRLSVQKEIFGKTLDLVYGEEDGDEADEE